MPIFPTIKLNIERWKYNPTFELYVSNMGHIKNKSKADIAPKIGPSGYVVVFVHGSQQVHAPSSCGDAYLAPDP